jgi:transitional endoplasmic reticulum ATPase
VANESDANLPLINGPEIMGSAYGESEKRLRDVFERGEQDAPSIVFIDEIDSIAPKRGQVSGEPRSGSVAQLLTLMDGLEARRERGRDRRDPTGPRQSTRHCAGRPLRREIVVGVPTTRPARDPRHPHRGMPLAENVDLGELRPTTYGFVGADLAALTREAAIEAIRRLMPQLNLAKARSRPKCSTRCR